jgi:hypothetical protein
MSPVVIFATPLILIDHVSLAYLVGLVAIHTGGLIIFVAIQV